MTDREKLALATEALERLVALLQDRHYEGPLLPAGITSLQNAVYAIETIKGGNDGEI